MVAACPKCGARYRIERGRLRAEGTRLRCSRCEAVFRVSPPPEEPLEEAAPPKYAEPPAPKLAAQTDAERLVLIAHAEVESGKAIASWLVDGGLQPVLVHDGVEAILTIQRTLPQAVVLDAALPKMFGFQVCELMKRNDSLRHIRVVLVGAINNRDRYRRQPNEIYGADAYLERHQLEESLLDTLAGLGLRVATAPAPRPVVRPAPPAPPPAPVRKPVAVPQRPRQEPVRQEPARPAVAADPGLAAEIGRAERLARIIVSDVILYNEDKLDAAIRAGNVVQAFEAEMQEGRGHFAQRVDARVRETRDFLSEELLRVARSRGMR